jgi:hypothetical protein
MLTVLLFRMNINKHYICTILANSGTILAMLEIPHIVVASKVI